MNKSDNHIFKKFIIKRQLLDFIYPNRCPLCNGIIPYDEYFCKECSRNFSSPPDFSDEHLDNIDCLCAVTVYDEVSRPFVMEMKQNNNGYALSAAGFLIYKQLRRQKLLESIDIITFIPMRKKDIHKRGYNQTKCLAKEISGLSSTPLLSLLKKIKDTSQQKQLNAAQRKENIKGAFGFSNNKVDLKGKTVLIVDDVCTTGSTLSEAAKELKKNGAKKVIAAVFARTVLD